jgi:hypothetical protein
MSGLVSRILHQEFSKIGESHPRERLLGGCLDVAKTHVPRIFKMLDR